MFVTHPPALLSIVHHKDKAKPSRKHVEMASEEKQLQKYTVNEQGEHEEKKMSVNCLLNNPSEIVHIKSNILHSSASGMRVYYNKRCSITHTT